MVRRDAKGIDRVQAVAGCDQVERRDVDAADHRQEAEALEMGGELERLGGLAGPAAISIAPRMPD